MKRIIGLLCILCVCLGCQEKPDGANLFEYASAHKNTLRFGVYVTVHAVENELNDTAGLREALSVLQSLGVTKIILETYRSGLVADETHLSHVRDFFLQNGFAVVGGIATTPGGSFGVRQEGQLGWVRSPEPSFTRSSPTSWITHLKTWPPRSPT